MKHKSIICLCLAFLVVFSVFSVTTHFINAASAPILSIVPTGDSGAAAGSTAIIPAQAVGSTFSVDVRVDNYASVNIGGTNNGVSGASYMVTWNSTVLKYVSYQDGSWLPDQSNTGDLTTNVTIGQLLIGQIAFNTANAMATADSASGSVSATIKFQVLSTGSTLIALEPQPGVAYLLAPETAADGLTSGHAVSGTQTANAQFSSSLSSGQSVNIDVYTVEGASGQTYGPLQLVPTYALITNASVPIPNQSVMFTIRDANGTCYYRQGDTNESGIATINPPFRMPPDLSQKSFGTWSITASANVLGETVYNTVNFTFGYLNNIEKTVTIPTSIHRGETLPIQFTIDNQELSASLTQVSITLFDNASTPIGSSTLTVTQQTQNITVVDAAITIPSWAFTGEATAYICLLGGSTGVPLVPESEAHFNILS
jgi:hypothetical protein